MIQPIDARPSDITLPEGWNWDRVEAERAQWGLADNLIPVATAPGCVAWGAIKFARLAKGSAA